MEVDSLSVDDGNLISEGRSGGTEQADTEEEGLDDRNMAERYVCVHGCMYICILAFVYVCMQMCVVSIAGFGGASRDKHVYIIPRDKKSYFG